MDEKEVKAGWVGYILIIISVLISLHYHNGLELKEYSVWGLKFSLNNTSLIVAMAWLGWAYASYRYTHFLFDKGLDVLSYSYAYSLAKELAVRELRNRRSAVIERDSSWKGANVKLKSIQIETWDRYYISLLYRGDIVKHGKLSIGETLPLTSYSAQWSLAMRLRALIHLLISRPLVVDILMPVLIGLSPLAFMINKLIF